MKRLLILLVLCLSLVACGGDDDDWGQFFEGGKVDVTHHSDPAYGNHTELKGTLKKDAWFCLAIPAWYLLRKKRFRLA